MGVFQNKLNKIIATPTESSEQKTLVRWARLHKLFIIHIANEGKRSPRSGASLRDMGMSAGFPDLFLPYPRGEFHGLFIEMKRINGHGPTKNQDLWLKNLNTLGYYACVSYGWEEAAREITNYMKL
jgi:hypothetical protein